MQRPVRRERPKQERTQSAAPRFWVQPSDDNKVFGSIAFHFDPVAVPAWLVATVRPFANDAFQSHGAALLEELVPAPFNMIDVSHTKGRVFQGGCKDKMDRVDSDPMTLVFFARLL